LRLIGLWAPVVAFMVGVWVLSGPEHRQAAPPVWDKLLHAIAYLVFGLFCMRATHGELRAPRALPTGLALLIAVGFGALDEWHQAYVPGRDASAADWLADALGVGLAAAALGLYFHLSRARRIVGGSAGNRSRDGSRSLRQRGGHAKEKVRGPAG